LPIRRFRHCEPEGCGNPERAGAQSWIASSLCSSQ